VLSSVEKQESLMTSQKRAYKDVTNSSEFFIKIKNGNFNAAVELLYDLKPRLMVVFCLMQCKKIFLICIHWDFLQTRTGLTT
jgi:hypothetical protein